MVRLDEFIELYLKVTARDYVSKENEWHVKQLCYCRHKVLNQDYREVALSDSVIIGQLVDIGVMDILGVERKVYSKEVGKYRVFGTPDIYNGDLVEIKFSAYKPSKPRGHDLMQVKLYLWLLTEPKGYLWYLTPRGRVEFEVTGIYTDSAVINFIEKPRNPMWEWECLKCSLYPCKYVIRI